MAAVWCFWCLKLIESGGSSDSFESRGAAKTRTKDQLEEMGVAP